jgi:Zn-dependent M32 family carboxypeptidase
LQEGRHLAKDLLFGSADDNVQYADGLQAELRAMGHEVELLFSDRKTTIQQVGSVVLAEEMARLKKLKTTMDREQQQRYVKRWKKENEVFLNNVFGLPELANQKRFLKGVLFAPSSSKHLAPTLQDVFQADGAHSNFGKYTLFSVYGTNANGHMTALAFGLLFGNEDKTNWSHFWTFVKRIHPSVDALTKTILTDI